MMVLLTGCDADVSLYVDSDKWIERIMISESNSVLNEFDNDFNNSEYESLYGDQLSYELFRFEDGKKFNREFSSFDDKSQYVYDTNYGIKKFDDMSLIGNCYDDIYITNGKNLMIETSDKFKGYELYDLLDNVEISIYTKKQLIRTNADRQDEGKYTWFVNRDNYENKKILLEVKNTKVAGFSWFKALGLGILLVLSVVVIVVIKFGYKDSSNYSEY